MAYTTGSHWEPKSNRDGQRNSGQNPALPDRIMSRHLRGLRSINPQNGTATPVRESETAQRQDFSIACQNTDGSIQRFDHSCRGDIGLRDVCGSFARGTLIKTETGAVSIEDLQPGDRIFTKDNGPQALRWIGSCTLAIRGERVDEDQLPIRIKADALGFLRPEQDLLVASGFRLLVNHPSCATLFGSPETLAPALNFLDGDDILRVHTSTDMVFYNLMFDQHQILQANGLDCESYHPGNFGMSVMSLELQSHFLAIFPHLNGDLSGFGSTARPILKGFEAEVLKVG